MRVPISGSAPTTIRIRAWLDGSSEPSTWQYTGVDAAPTTLQTPGVRGLRATQRGTSTAITVRFDDLVITYLRATQSRTVIYGYDGLQRLTSAVESGFSANSSAYTYDTRGNRLTATGQPTLTYNAANQVVGWTYDAAGNLLSDPSTGSGQVPTTRSYDALNRVITQAGVTNLYNGDGTLVRSGTTNSMQDLAAPLSQILSDGTTQYVYGLDRLYSTASGARTWYLADRLGSVRATANDVGTVLATASYEPYGGIQGSALDSFGFTGELQQGNAVYLRARWYDAGRGRFAGRDPFAGWGETPQSLHHYTYVHDDPVNATDPTGWYRCQDANDVAYQEFCAIQRRWLAGATQPFEGKEGQDALGGLLFMFADTGTSRDLPGGSGTLARKYRQQGMTPAQERLDFVLWATHDRNEAGQLRDPSRPNHFAGDFRFTDGGFAIPFRDSNIWPDSGNQVGHFLGAAHIGYDSGSLTGGYLTALTCYIGHELVSDDIVPKDRGRDAIQCAASQVARYALPGSTEYNQTALSLYVLARDADQAGRIALRDCLLQTLVGLPEALQADSHSGLDDPRFAARAGNSVQDLRLTLKGEVFGQSIRDRRLRTVGDAHQWIDITLRQNRRVLLTP